ncbi:MAG: hypothetical protein ABFE13_24260 [Phycisphaerales bacterium]
MNRWVRRILIVLEVGGGFTGLSLMLVSLKSATNMPAHAVVGLSLFACVFLFGIVSGLALADRLRMGIVLSAIYQTVQIPIVSSSSVSYKLFSGAQIGLQWREGGLGITFDYGARSFLGWMHRDPFQIGIDVLALGLLVYLLTVKPEGKPLGHDGIPGTANQYG